MPYLNPAYKAAFAHTAGAALTVTVAFDTPSVAGGGLSISPSHCPTELGVPASECAWYAVQTVDGCVVGRVVVALTCSFNAAPSSAQRVAQRDSCGLV